MAAVSAARYGATRGGDTGPRAAQSPAAPETPDVIAGMLRSTPVSMRHMDTGAGLPIPVLPDAPPGTRTRWVVTPVDRDGRLADRSALTFMHWSSGREVALTVEPGPIVVARRGRGVRLNSRGHLRLPLTVRRTCRIAAGDRMLVAANLHWVELLVIPMAALDAMVAAFRSSNSEAGQ